MIDLDTLERELEKGDAETESFVEPNVLLNLGVVQALVRAVQEAILFNETRDVHGYYGGDGDALDAALAPFR